MALRKIASFLVGTALATGSFIVGCNPQVDYKPKTSTTPGEEQKYRVGSATSSDATTAKAATTPTNDKSPRAAAPSTPVTDIIAYDEFDGEHRAGWKQPELGEWKSAGEEKEGAFVVSGDVDIYRELAEPVTGIAWMAVTMRMNAPITGIASVDGSPGPTKRFFKMGFSAVDQPYTSRGFWMETEQDTKMENTELQTFLTRYSFDSHNAMGFAGRGYGLALVDYDGMVFQRPRMKMDGTFAADRLSHVSLKKGGPEKLIIERIAIARTPEGALFPQLPATARRPDDKPPETAQPKPAAPETKKDAAAAEPKEETSASEPKNNAPAAEAKKGSATTEIQKDGATSEDAPAKNAAPESPAGNTTEEKKPK